MRTLLRKTTALFTIMTSLTETVEQLLTKKVSFPNLLNKREIWNCSDAESIMKAAINKDSLHDK